MINELTAAVRRVSRMDISAELKEQILAKMKDRNVVVRIPREVVKKMSKAYAEHDRLVVSRSRKTGSFKVFSLDGYRSAVASCKKNKPWNKVGGKN